MTEPTERSTAIRYTARRHVASLLRPHRWLVAGMAAVSLPAAACESAVLVLVAEIAGALVQHARRVSLNAGPLHLAGSIDQFLVVGAVLAVTRIGLQFPVSYLPAVILADVQKTIRERLSDAYLNAGWELKSSETEGRLQELLTSQTVQATYIIQVALGIVTTSVTVAILVASALTVGLVPALAVIGAAALLFSGLRPLGRLGGRRAQALAAEQIAHADVVSETARLAEEIQVFGVGGAFQRRIGDSASGIRRRFLMTSFLGSLAPGVYYGMVLLLLVGGLAALAATGSTRTLSLGAAVLLLVRAANYGQMLQNSYQSWKQSAPFLAKLGQTESLYRAGGVRRGGLAIESVPKLAFENVTYSYGRGVPAVRDVTIEVEAGEAIGIVGPTGAGKSTLIQLILGLREPSSGRCLIDGRPANQYAASAMARCFAYVPQEPKLVQATVAENIAFFRDLDRPKLEHAAHLARIDQDIAEWPVGYDTLIGQRMDGVSGGQRQRLCLARALAGDPLVLVLDEPTSSLDATSEALVQESLAALKGRLTIFVVAHRLSTLTFCDKILVLVGGRMEAVGPAAQLLKEDGFYGRAASASVKR